MTRDRDSGKHKPALGRSWSFVPSTRLLLDISRDAGAGSRRVARLTKSPRLVSRPQGESQDSRPLRVVSGPTGVSLRNSWMLRPCSRRGLCRSSHCPLLSPSSQQVSRRWWTLGPGGFQSRIRHRAMTYDCAGRQRARCQDPTLLHSNARPSLPAALGRQRCSWAGQTPQSSALLSRKHSATGKRGCRCGKTQKFTLVPGFLPLFLPYMFPRGAEFSLAWASEEAF